MVAHTGGMPSCPPVQLRRTRVGEFILNRFKCSFVRIFHNCYISTKCIISTDITSVLTTVIALFN